VRTAIVAVFVLNAGQLALPGQDPAYPLVITTPDLQGSTWVTPLSFGGNCGFPPGNDGLGAVLLPTE
jgi:hypothetical protein